MTDMMNIQEKLQDTQAAIARMERALATNPKERSLSAMLRSLERRRASLEESFVLATESLGREICSYRIIPTDSPDPISLTSVTHVLSAFQEWFSVVYDALTHGPKERARLGPEVLGETKLDWAYAFSGSVGIVLTVPNERLLFGETKLDQAMQTVCEMASADNQKAVQTHAKTLGKPAVLYMYKWAQAHVIAQVGADVHWGSGEEAKSTMLVQRPEFERLKTILEETSEVTEHTFTTTGTLVGADFQTRTFHMSFAEAADIRGRLSDKIQPTVEIPRTYQATIIKTTMTKYSTEEEVVTHVLVALDPA